MEKELLIKEVFNRTLYLVRRYCCYWCNKSKQDCTWYSDTEGCMLRSFLEWYEDAIEMLNVDSITEAKIKEYFLEVKIEDY